MMEARDIESEEESKGGSSDEFGASVEPGTAPRELEAT